MRAPQLPADADGNRCGNRPLLPAHPTADTKGCMCASAEKRASPNCRYWTAADVNRTDENGTS